MGQYEQILHRLRTSFASGKTKSYEWRISQLKALLCMIQENEEKIQDALAKDLHRPKYESTLMDVIVITGDIIEAMNNLRQWMKPEKVAKSSLYLMDNTYIQREPLGTALIIGAWNYPFQISLVPLIGAIAAGNCAIVKPSEVAEYSANLMKDLTPKYLDQDCIQVVTGSVPETTALLEEKFDLIFYTGGASVGKIIMTAAAKHLTPVVLELGGKSPVYIDEDADMKTVARRISWGKCCNSGQTCVAPDYVLCPKSVQESFIKEMKTVLDEFYTEDPQKSESFGRIINARHFMRIQKLKKGATVAVGGQEDESDLYIAPTVLTDVKMSDPVMQEEIFGPLLPVIMVKDHNEAIQIINEREKPLSLYVFTNKKTISNDFLHKTSSGALVVNDTMVHGGLSTLPFGGVGHSGIGSYHGKFTFEAFCHHKAVMERPLSLDQVNAIRYPPYSDKKLGWIRWMLSKKLKRGGLMGFLPFMILGTIFALFFKTLSLTG